MSPYHFHRVFKAVAGVTPKAYADARRAKRLRDELAHADGTVTAAIYDAGFNYSGRFYETAHQVLGMKPTAYRERKSVVEGKSVYVRVDLGGRRCIKTKKK